MNPIFFKDRFVIDRENILAAVFVFMFNLVWSETDKFTIVFPRSTDKGIPRSI